MLKFIFGLALVLFAAQANAQTSFTAKDATGTTRTFKSFDCSSTICALNIPADTTGAALGVSGNPFYVTSIPITTGGLSVYNVQPAASDNHANIKNGAGQVYKISVTGNATQTTVQYLRLYNAASGFNGCNSATNLVYQTAIPFATGGAGVLDQWPNGIAFSTGISICVTGGYATNDTTNATASAMIVNIGYK